jgi:hypothetical protein
VLALYEWQDRYRKPLKTFLNDYLSAHRDVALGVSDGIGKLFVDAIHAVDQAIGKAAFRPERALNVAFVDSIVVGLMRRLSSGTAIDSEQLSDAYETLAGDNEFVSATNVRTSDEDNVILRLSKATAAFAG